MGETLQHYLLSNRQLVLQYLHDRQTLPIWAIKSKVTKDRIKATKQVYLDCSWVIKSVQIF